MLLATLLLTVAAVGQLLGYWFAVPEHIVDRSWPLHARFHMVQAFFWITGLDLALLVLIWWPLQHREAWSLWALLALFVFAQLSYFLAILIQPKGRPRSRGNWYEWMYGLDAVLYAVGLVLAARVLGFL
jgi:cell division protein FtsW (lipid II flippase)